MIGQTKQLWQKLSDQGRDICSFDLCGIYLALYVSLPTKGSGPLDPLDYTLDSSLLVKTKPFLATSCQVVFLFPSDKPSGAIHPGLTLFHRMMNFPNISRSPKGNVSEL